MALSTPVATTSALAVDEVIVDGESGVVAPTTAALEGPLLSVLEDRARLHSLGVRAAEQATRRFGFDTITDAYADFFAASVRRRRSGVGSSR
jgi:glycosyltransferase involved in cell wall biosynthesis